jgi:hypothetical protein
MTSKDLIEIIFVLQDEIDEVTNGECDGISLRTDGSYHLIEFLGIQLWSSAYDERNPSAGENDYEPMEGFLRRRLNEEISKIKKLKF